MRDIKFRAWDRKNKKWLLGYNVGSLGGFSMFGECMMFGEWSEILSTGLSGQNGYSLDDLALMQFTGLEDRKGKEIYEGDLLKSIENYELYRIDSLVPAHCHAHATNVAFWYDGKWNPRKITASQDNNDDWMSWPEMYEVIGNIYENPELLKD